MKRIFALTALVLSVIVAALVVWAAHRPPKLWPQEPASFLGVQLGAPLSSSLHACNPLVASKAPCFELSDERNTIQNVEGYWEITVDALDGKVVGISAFYDRDTGSAVFADLAKRFGRPQESSQDAIGKRAVWHGTVVTLMFYDRTDGSGFMTAGLNDHRYRPAAVHWYGF